VGGVAAEAGGQVVARAGPLVRAADAGRVLHRQRGGIDLLAVASGSRAARAPLSCSNAPHSQRVRRLASLWCGSAGKVVAPHVITPQHRNIALLVAGCYFREILDWTNIIIS
jgi:hypothetical protein